QLNAAQSSPGLAGGWHLAAPAAPPQHDLRTKDLGINIGFMGRRGGGWEEGCERLGIPRGIGTDERYATPVGRSLNQSAFRAALEPYTTRYTAAELKPIVENAGGVAVVCNTYETLFNDPQMDALDMLREVEHPTAGRVRTIGLPWNLERTPGS